MVVEVEGLCSTNGELKVAVFGRAGFPLDEDRRVAGRRVAITGSNVVVRLAGIAYGEYALAAYHDANLNGRLDRDWLGRPREGYGVSGNARRALGPPPFEAAKLRIAAPEIHCRIRLTY